MKEVVARLFSVVPSDRTRDDGHKLKNRSFPLNSTHFTLRMIRHRNSCPEWFRSVYLWKCSKPNWTCSWTTCFRWPFL